MKVVSLPKLKALSVFLALVLTFSSSRLSHSGAAKRKKSATRTVKKSAKSRSKSGRTVARRGGSKSKLKAGRSRRGRRLNARGRSRRSRWQTVASSLHSSGVHKFRPNPGLSP
jgi:hypothetical protein